MDPVFLILSLVTVVSALLVVTRRNPVYSAVWLLVCFLAFAVFYLKLAAAFLAVIHVLVYTGAILVLFVFVIMLLNLSDKELGEEYPVKTKLVGAAFCLGLFVTILVPVLRDPELAKPLGEVDEKFGDVASVGMLLFNDYALPFELVSVLILVAMFGSMILAKRTLWTKKT